MAPIFLTYRGGIYRPVFDPDEMWSKLWPIIKKHLQHGWYDYIEQEIARNDPRAKSVKVTAPYSIWEKGDTRWSLEGKQPNQNVQKQVEQRAEREAYREYRKLVYQLLHLDGKPCWRAIVVPNEFDVTDIKKLGIYWSQSYWSAVPANTFFDWYGKQFGKHIVVYKATIDLAKVDWLHTLEWRHDLGAGEVEKEIRFKERSRLWVDEALVFSNAESWAIRVPDLSVRLAAWGST